MRSILQRSTKVQVSEDVVTDMAVSQHLRCKDVGIA